MARMNVQIAPAHDSLGGIARTQSSLRNPIAVGRGRASFSKAIEQVRNLRPDFRMFKIRRMQTQPEQSRLASKRAQVPFQARLAARRQLLRTL